MIQVWTRDAKAIEVDPKEMPITAAVAEFLEINDWKDKININDKKTRTTLEYTINSRGIKHKIFIEAQEEYERISVYAYTTFEVPPARMGEMARLINIMNMVKHFGRFGCADDDESNAVQFCLTYDVEGGSITGKQIDVMADEAIRWYGRWHSLLASVALTKTTAKEAWATHLEDVAATEAMPDLVIRNGTIQEEVDKSTNDRAEAPRLLVSSDSRAELRDFPDKPDLGAASGAIEKMLMALGAKAVRVVSPSNNKDDGRSTYLSFRVQLPDDLFFDCVHLGVWHAPEVELTFWAGGNCADPASIKALVAWPEVISTAGDVIRIVHPSARGEPFMTHKFYDDGSGHVCISLVL